MVLASLLSTLVALAPVAAQDAPAPQAPSAAPERESRTGDMRDGYRVIVGRTHPELIPEWDAWCVFFTVVHAMAAHGDDPNHPKYRDFVSANVFISDADAAIVLEVASRYRGPQRVANQAEPVAEDGPAEEQPEAALSEKTLRERTERLWMDAREEVLTRVTPRGARALQRYITTQIKPGMITEVRP